MKMPLVIDGVTYRVGIVYDSIIRTFEKVEGPANGDMMSGRHEMALLGTRFPYQLHVEADPDHPEDYDALYDHITDPNIQNYTVTVPFGQGTLTYQAQILSGSDTYKGPVNGYHRFSGLIINYRPANLQRIPS